MIHKWVSADRELRAVCPETDRGARNSAPCAVAMISLFATPQSPAIAGNSLQSLPGYPPSALGATHLSVDTARLRNNARLCCLLSSSLRLARRVPLQFGRLLQRPPQGVQENADERGMFLLHPRQDPRESDRLPQA